MPLGHEGWEGVVAGVGDLAQARRDGWELIGGDTVAPINRDTYRVAGVRSDGGLTAARVVERGPDGEMLGAPLALSNAPAIVDMPSRIRRSAGPSTHNCCRRVLRPQNKGS